MLLYQALGFAIHGKIEFNLEIEYLQKAMDFCLLLKIRVKVFVKI